MSECYFHPGIPAVGESEHAPLCRACLARYEDAQRSVPATKTASRTWQPGHDGKGVMDHLGELHHWKVDEEGAPTHTDMFDPKQIQSYLYISPDGQTDIDGPHAPEEVFEKDNRLTPESMFNKWDFNSKKAAVKWPQEWMQPWNGGGGGKGFYHIPTGQITTWTGPQVHDEMIKHYGGVNYNDPDYASFTIPSNGGGPYIYPMPGGKRPPQHVVNAIEHHVSAPIDDRFDFFSKRANTEELQRMFGPFLDVNPIETSNSISFDNLNVNEDERGKGYGTRFMNALKHYTDMSGKKLTINRVDNEPFFSKFPWLTPGADQTYSYDPTP